MALDPLRSLFGGFIRIHILYHAAKEAIWGLEMIEELKRHGYRLSPGTLYPILHQLQEAGYLTCEAEIVSGRRRKKYRITKAGRTILAETSAKVRELVDEVLEHRDNPTESSPPPKRRGSLALSGDS